MLAEALRFLGYDVGIANDGQGALALVDEFMAQIALIDIGLPDMNGYELARHLRQRPGLETIPIMAITDYGQPTDLERSRAEGFADHLIKPIDLDFLHQSIERAVERAVPADEGKDRMG